MSKLLVAAALLGLFASPAAAQPYTPAEQEVLYRRQVEPLLGTVSIIALAQRCDAASSKPGGPAANASRFGDATGPALPVQYDVAISRVGEAISDALLQIGADNNRGVRDYEEARAAGARFASPASCAGLAANAEAVLEIKQMLQAYGH